MFADLNLNLTLTVIGIVIAIFAPVIGWLFRRKERYQLDVVLDKEVFLVNKLAGGLKNFAIMLDDKPASDQVVWITGWVINSGNFDISERMIEQPLILRLPENMQWLRGNVEHCPIDVKCDLQMIGEHELQLSWVLLKSGEFIYFDALLQCPLEETMDAWDTDSLAEVIKPYSRIENIRTESLVPLSQLGERYNPFKTRKRHLIPKLVVTFTAISFLAFMWMRVFFPFELDNLFGDGFLRGTPKLVKRVDSVPVEVSVFLNKKGHVKLKPKQADKDAPLPEKYVFSTPEELFSQDDIRIGKISVRDLLRETLVLILLGFLTIFFTWILLYIWFPRMFLFDSKIRRTTSSLSALQRQTIGKKSNS